MKTLLIYVCICVFVCVFGVDSCSFEEEDDRRQRLMIQKEFSSSFVFLANLLSDDDLSLIIFLLCSKFCLSFQSIVCSFVCVE